MPSEISIQIKDKISKTIEKKLIALGSAASIANVNVNNLKRNLNFGGIKLGISTSGLSNMDRELIKTQRETEKLKNDQENLRLTTLKLNTEEAKLNLTLNQLAESEKRLGAMGLQAAAAQNKLAAANAKLSKTSKVTSNLTSDLTAKEVVRATALTNLRLKQKQVEIANVRLQTSQARLAKILNQTTAAEKRQELQAAKLARSSSLAANSIARLSRNVAFLRKNLFATRGALGATVQGLRSYISLGALIGAGGAIKGVDAYRTIENQLRQNVSGQTELNQLTEQLFGVATRARVPVTSLTVAFRRYDNALAQAGQTQKQSLRITETIGKMLALNGASAQESASALLQLSQAFNKGKLDGDEFRTVAEVMPQILDALARATGKSRKELFDLSRQGELTRDILIKAFEDLEKPIDKLMKSAGRTATQAFIELVNKVIFAFGEFDKRTGFLDKVNSALDFMGNHIKEIVVGFQAFVAGVLASGALSAIATILASIASGFGVLAVIPAIFGAIVANLVMAGKEIIVFEKHAITLKEILDNVMFALSDITKALGIYFNGLMKVFGDDPQSQFDLMVDALKLIKNLFKEVTSSALGFVQTLVQTLQGEDGLKQLGLILLELPAMLSKSIIKFIKTISVALAPALADLFIQISNWSDALGIHIENQLRKLFNTVFWQDLDMLKVEDTQLQKGTEAYREAHDRFVNSIVNFGGNEEQFGSALDSMFSTTAVDTFFSTWTHNTRYLKNETDQLFESVGDALISSVQETRMRTMFVEMKESVMGFIVETIQSSKVLETFITNLANQFLSIAQAFDRITGNVFSVAEKIQSGMNALGLINRRGGVFGSDGSGGEDKLGLDKVGEQASGLKSVFQNLSNAFQNFVRTGKLSFKELIRSILADLLRLFMNNLFKQLFGGMLGGAGGIMGFAGGGAVPSASTSFGDGKQFGPMAGKYYANGGFTGGGARNGIAGFVHGQEYVMPASQTTKYRSTLDAMRNGTLKTGSTAGGGVMVNVNNYTDSDVSVKKNKNGELELTIREIARQQIAEQTPKLIATNLRNANSRESKALGQSTYTRRKR